MPAAARVGDQVLQDNPHCHTTHAINPVPHPAIPLAIMSGSPTVMIGGAAAARVTDQTDMCKIPGCAPGGPGMISKGSGTVKISGMAAARMGDATSHSACGTAPIAAPTGKVIPTCCPKVEIGG